MSESRRRAATVAAIVCLVLLYMDESSFRQELKRKQNLRSNAAMLHTLPPSTTVAAQAEEDSGLSSLTTTAGGTEWFAHQIGNATSPIEEEQQQPATTAWANLTASVFVQSSAEVTPVVMESTSSHEQSSVRVYIRAAPARSSPPPPPMDDDEGMRVHQQPLSDDKKPTAPASLLQLRWHVTRDEASTNLAALASRVRGILYHSSSSSSAAHEHEEESSIRFEGVVLRGATNTLTLFTIPGQRRRRRQGGYITHLGLETCVAADSSNATTTTRVLRGAFGGERGLELGGLVADGDKEDDDDDNDNEDDDASPSPPTRWLFPGCAHPVRVDVNLSVSSSSPMLLECANSSTSPILLPQWQRVVPLDLPRALDKAGYFSFLCAVETMRVGYLLTNLIPSPSTAQPDYNRQLLAPLSLTAFTWLAITDFYILEVLLASVWSLPSSKGFWITALVLKCAQFLVSHAPFLVLVFLAQFPDQSQGQVRQHFSNCLTRTQLSLVFALIGFELVRKHHPLAFALVFVSFWVPQVLHGVHTESSVFEVMSVWEVVDLSVQRALYPVLAMSTTVLDELAAVDQFGQHGDSPVHNLAGAALCVGWVVVQVAVMYSMHVWGPRWFVPRAWVPVKYDYFDTTGKQLAGAEEVECAICMLPCSTSTSSSDGVESAVAAAVAAEGERIMVTPCQHAFHAKCLVPWMRAKLTAPTCPTCRTALPKL